MGFIAETGSGHTLVMDGAPDTDNPANGGQNLAPRPLETVLAGTVGCKYCDLNFPLSQSLLPRDV
jgi:putative redox protein